MKGKISMDIFNVLKRNPGLNITQLTTQLPGGYSILDIKNTLAYMFSQGQLVGNQGRVYLKRDVSPGTENIEDHNVESELVQLCLEAACEGVITEERIIEVLIESMNLDSQREAYSRIKAEYDTDKQDQEDNIPSHVPGTPWNISEPEKERLRGQFDEMIVPKPKTPNPWANICRDCGEKGHMKGAVECPSPQDPRETDDSGGPYRDNY